jgi:S-adenosylhomocysteine hydrolase
MSTTTETKLSYKVKDISLAEWGRKEIRLAEDEMPGLDESSCRSIGKSHNLLAGAQHRRMFAHDHPDRSA